MDFKIKNIKVFDLAITIAIFEFFALLFIWILGVNNNITGNLLLKLFKGFLIGVFTTFPALLIFNNTKLKLRFDKITINKINSLHMSIGNGLFLALLFFIESILSRIKSFNVVFGNAIVGFLTTFLTIFVLISVYNNQKFKLKLFTIKQVELNKISWFNTALFVAVIECFILPLMTLLLLLSNNILWYGISGFISGFIGVYFATIIYNKFLVKKFSIRSSFNE